MIILGRESTTIKQVISPGGWSAMFADSSRRYWSFRPLVAWALVRREDGVEDLVGLSPLGGADFDVIIASDHERFLGYLPRRVIPREEEMEYKLGLMRRRIVKQEVQELSVSEEILQELAAIINNR